MISLVLLAQTAIFGILIIFALGTMVSFFWNIWWFKLKKQFMLAKDERLAILTSMIKNIKFIKLKSMENYYHALVYLKRQAEINILITCSYVIGAISMFNWLTVSFVYIFAVFWILIYLPWMNIAGIAGLIKILNNMDISIKTIPYVTSNLVDTFVSLKRLNEYLLIKEVDTSYIQFDKNKEYDIVIENGWFYWKLNDTELTQSS